MLRSKYNPNAYPMVREDIFELKPPGEKLLALGADVVTEIQANTTEASGAAIDVRKKSDDAKKDAPASKSSDSRSTDRPPKRGAETAPATKDDLEPEDLP